jgi:hypothetical protein
MLALHGVEAFSSPAPTTPPPRAPRALLCTGRRRRVTSTEARIDVAGRHEHECVNPHGWRWRNGCFAIAEGLIVASEPESYWILQPLWRAHQAGSTAPGTPPSTASSAPTSLRSRRPRAGPVIAVMESVTS